MAISNTVELKPQRFKTVVYRLSPQTKNIQDYQVYRDHDQKNNMDLIDIDVSLSLREPQSQPKRQQQAKCRPKVHEHHHRVQ